MNFEELNPLYHRLTGPKGEISLVQGFSDIFRAIFFLVASVWLFTKKLHSLSLYPLACIVIGSLQFYMLNLAHSGLHWHIFHNKRWNDIITAWLLSYPIGTNLHYSRYEHFQHHLHFNTDKDPVRSYYKNIWFETRPYLILYFLRKLLIIDSFLRLFSIIQKSTRNGQSRARIKSEFIKIVLVQILIFFWFVYYAKAYDYLLFWVLPAMTVANFLLSLRSYVEHAQSESFEKIVPKTGLYIIDAPYYEKVSLGSFGFDLHAMHHFYPTIPYYQMPLYEKIASQDHNLLNLYSIRKGYLSFFLSKICSRKEMIHA